MEGRDARLVSHAKGNEKLENLTFDGEVCGLLMLDDDAIALSPTPDGSRLMVSARDVDLGGRYWEGIGDSAR